MHESRHEKLLEFVTWTKSHITGDEKGEAQIFLDRLFHILAIKLRWRLRVRVSRRPARA